MISIIIATYGEGWVSKNMNYFERALKSALDQTIPVDVVWEHGPYLAAARNRGARHAVGDRLVFLDADDWLAPDFAEQVTQTEDVLQPITAMHTDQHVWFGYLEPRENFIDGNHIIVGAPVKKDIFMEVGGFKDWEMYEDWALWLDIQKAGGTFGRTEAIYNVTDRPNSRNKSSKGPLIAQLIREEHME